LKKKFVKYALPLLLVKIRENKYILLRVDH